MAESVEEQIEYGGYCSTHGNPIGTPGGADIMCHLCEVGFTKWVENPEYTLQMRLMSPGKPLYYQGAWISLGPGFLTIRESQMVKANRTLLKIRKYLLVFAGHSPYDGIFEWRMKQTGDGYWDYE
jgi:hypothetical protein